MIDERIKLKLSEIYNQKELHYPLNVAMMSAWLTINFKAESVKIVDLENKSSLCDYFVVANVENNVQAASIIDGLCKNLKAFNIRSSSIEGSAESDWFLVDLGDTIVHVFLKESRDLYDLESLWRDSKSIEIPKEYYFESRDFVQEMVSTTPQDDQENYY